MQQVQMKVEHCFHHWHRNILLWWTTTCSFISGHYSSNTVPTSSNNIMSLLWGRVTVGYNSLDFVPILFL